MGGSREGRRQGQKGCCLTWRACAQPPNFYDSTPPAPPGLEWWHYKPGVPPLSDPGTVNPAFTGYQWRYNPDWRPIVYTFNNMDQARRLLPVLAGPLPLLCVTPYLQTNNHYFAFHGCLAALSMRALLVLLPLCCYNAG